ncbi:MAG: prephenate dehydratase [Planctomycetaceae bacterium]|nr:prephenate dehydratase [Planctomycetaceae bacterium]
MADLSGLREKIDSIDAELVKLLNQRAELVVQVGKVKRATGVPIYAPHREQQVLRKVLGLSRGPLPPKTIEAVYRELMSGSFHLEQPLRIGFLGPVGSYSHYAAVKHFGSSVDYENLRAVEGVFTEVARGHVDYGLVPIESSSGGGVAETMDAFAEFQQQLNIYAEVQLELRRCLLTNVTPNKIQRIYSTAEAFAHCRKWLALQFPTADLVVMESSATAAQRAKDETDTLGNVAAIGNELAGETYGLHALFQDIQDQSNHTTRFLVLSKQKTEPSGDDKTSLMFVTADRPGALVDVLAVFKRAGVNLTHIDKRPSGRVNWEYKFFVDAAGHSADPKFAEIVGEARAHCKELTVLGSYPASRRVL